MLVDQGARLEPLQHGDVVQASVARRPEERGPVTDALMASMMLFSVMWTVIDAFARIVSDIAYTNSRIGKLTRLFRPFRNLSLHHLYYGFIVFIILLGAALLPYKQPFALLTISGVFGGLSMALYVPFLWYLNVRRLPRELRPGILTQCALAGATIFYWFFVWRLVAPYVTFS